MKNQKKNKGKTSWKSRFDREIMLFLSMCRHDDSNFLNLPDKERKTEDYVRLIVISLALNLKSPMIRLLGEAERWKREEEIINYLEKIGNNCEIIIEWVDKFVNRIEKQILKQVAEEIWSAKKEDFVKNGFHISKII